MKSESFGLAGSAGERPALRAVSVAARVRGLVCETRIEQAFVNSCAHAIEAVYTFPLPTSAVLLGMDVELGERRAHALVVPRAEAEERYEDAIERGASAFRLQKIASGLYSVSLGNLRPGERVVLRYRHAQALAWQGDALLLRVPCVLAPRHGEPGALQPWQVPDVTLQHSYPLAVSVTLSGSLAHARLTSATHRIDVQAGVEETTVTLDRRAVLDRDFVLSISGVAQNAECCITADGDAHVALLAFSPRLPAGEPPAAPRTVIMLVDCSGSMAGDSIEQARVALHHTLDCLRDTDEFTVIAFGSQQRLLSSRTLPVATHRAEGHAFVAALAADLGGTELAEALECALGLDSRHRAVDVLLVTDGEVWLDDKVYAALATRGRRVFTVGVGAAVAEDVVRRLAEITHGACELVAPDDDMSGRIARHFARIHQPRIDRCTVHWPGAEPLWQAAWGGDALFAGDTVIRFARFAAPPAGSVTVGVSVAGDRSLQVEAPIQMLPAGSFASDTLPRLAVAARLPGVESAHAQALALAAQLVTDSTDCLLVLERAAGETVSEAPRLHVVPQMLAAGWGGTGTVKSVLGAAPAVMSAGRVGAVRAPTPGFASPARLAAPMESLDLPAAEAESARYDAPAARSPGAQAFLDLALSRARRPGTIFRRKTIAIPKSLAELPLDQLPPPLRNEVERLRLTGIAESALVAMLLVEIIDNYGLHVSDPIKARLFDAVRAQRISAREHNHLRRVLAQVAEPGWTRAETPA